MKFLKERIGIRKILPLCHFLLSFFYERLFIQFHPDIDIVAAIPRNDIISDGAERTVAYLVSKVIALVLIILLWRFVFFVKDTVRAKSYVKICTIIFTIGLLFQMLYWPNSFMASGDNLITYSYAIRLWPEYWHSLYSACVYCGCMMVFPHPISITLIQWVFAMAGLVYLIFRIDESPVMKGRGKYLPFLLLLIPKTFTLLTDSYRTEQYALLCMFFVSMLAMDAIDKKQRNTWELLAIICVCAFVSVWRSEGLILGFLSIIAMLFLGYKLSKKEKIVFLAIFIGAYFLIALPQKLGDKKYYGNDYTFINTFTTLHNILNSKDNNLKYDGVEKDLAAIEAVVPIEVIKMQGMEGYRRYNVLNGRKDINQSLASDAEGAAYKSAFYSLVLHNPTIYLRTQLGFCFSAIGLSTGPYYEVYDGDVTNILPEWRYDAYSIGGDDYLSTMFTRNWAENMFHQKLSAKIYKLLGYYERFIHMIRFDVISVFIIFAAAVYGVFRELYFLLKKEKANLLIGFLQIILLGQFLAIVLVMPADFFVYFHACIYSMAIVVLCNMIRINVERK